MALLGLFSRKDKKLSTSKASSSDSSNLHTKSSPNPSDSTSVAETDYVSVRRGALPHATNGPYDGSPAAAASTSKLRQAFGRKKSPTLLDGMPRLPLASSPPTSPPPVPYSPSILSDSVDDDHSFRPPPSKTSIFSAYADPKGALSTRSLPANRPNPYHSHNRSNSREAASVDVHALEPPPPLPHPVQKSGGGLFAWAHRGRKKSKPSDPPPQPPPHSLQSLSVDLSSDSFNLKSFRHIGGASDPSASPIDLLPRPPLSLAGTNNTNNTTNNTFNPQPPTLPHVRPRGDSIVSVDSAQRVSVAAFREMAARSRNNSPSPSLRPPSTTDLARLPPLDKGHSANSHLHAHGQTHGHLRPGGGIRPPALSTRSSIANALYTSTDTESETESSDPGISDQDDSEGEEDEAGEETLRPKRNGTITQRSPGMGRGKVGGKASSEMGHRVLRTPPSAPTSATRRVAKSSLGHGDSPTPNPQGVHHASSASASGLKDARGANVVGTRSRASASTSALQPNAAARRASMLANSKGPPVPSLPRKSLALASSSSSSSSSSSNSEKDSDSEDDAPLASFMLPKRPGSATSSSSRPRPPRPSKPLIDITTMGVSAPQSPVDRPPLPFSSSTSRSETQTPIRSESQPQPPLPSPPPIPEKSVSAPPAQTRPTQGMEKPSLSDRLAKLTQGQGTGAGRSVEGLAVGMEKERRSMDVLRLEGESERTKDKDMQNVRGNANGRAPPTRSQTAPLDTFSTPPTATSTPPPAKSSDTTNPTTSSPPSPTFSRPTRRSFTAPNAVVFDLTDEGAPPIVPRRIRERSPPPAFSVTSRPISQMSAGSGSGTGTKGVGNGNGGKTTQHAHNSSTSTIRMLGGSAIASSTTGGTVGNGTRDVSKKVIPFSADPPHTSGSPTTSTSSSSSSSFSSSPKNPSSPPNNPPAFLPPMKSTLAPPGNTQPILRAPPPRTSSRPRAASSSLIPYGGKNPPETEGFTGGGLVSTIVPELANGNGKKGKGVSSFARVGASGSSNLNGGVDSNWNANGGGSSMVGGGGVKTRGRSSTTIPMLDVGLDVGPSLSKAISDYSSVSGSGGSPRGGGGGGGGGGNSRSSTAMLAQPRPIPVNAKTNDSRISSTSARSPSTATATNSNSVLPYMIPSPSSGIPPPKPFAGGMRGNSPASSTGDSSNGRTPLTPADGSELGSAYSSSARGVAASSRGGGGGGGRSEVGKRSGATGGRREEGSVVSGATGGKGHGKNGSVGYQESERERERGKGSVGGVGVGEGEERRKERRRSEARNAIELGNVVNGRGPIANDDDDEDLPLNTMGPRMSIVNPMFNLTPPSPMSWRPPSAVLPPQSYMFPVPPPNVNPSFLAAHQQAMMVAKQAYQIAVAQQAMAQANEEWERGSTATSAAFGGSVAGFGGIGGMGGMPMSMGMGMGMQGMSPTAGGLFPGYGMGMQAGWPNGMMFPTSAQSMYAASMVGGGSEMGGNMSTVGNAGGGGGGWGTRSEYGGPSANRSSGMYRNSGVGFGQMGVGMHGGMQGGSAQSHYGPLESGGGRREGPRPRTKTAPSAKQGVPPPSSWKSNQQRRV